MHICDLLDPRAISLGCSIKTKEQAIELVNSELKKQMNDHIELTYKNCNYYVEVEQIGAKFDIESAVLFLCKIPIINDVFSNINVCMYGPD